MAIFLKGCQKNNLLINMDVDIASNRFLVDPAEQGPPHGKFFRKINEEFFDNP